MVAPVPYVKASEPHLLETYTPEVNKAYIMSRLDYVAIVLRSVCRMNCHCISVTEFIDRQHALYGECSVCRADLVAWNLLASHMQRACELNKLWRVDIYWSPVWQTDSLTIITPGYTDDVYSLTIILASGL